MRRFVIGFGLVAAVLLAVVLVVVVGRGSRLSGAEQARRVLRAAADRQRQGCARRPDFKVYTLGTRFQGLDAAVLGGECEGRADFAIVYYGPCDDGGESGCGYPVYIETQPACLRPRELDLRFNAPPTGDLTGRRTVTTLRGVPAAIYDYTIDLMTRDTLITISADAKPARAAIAALRPAAGPSPTNLPKPDASVVHGRLINHQCPP